MTIFQLTNEALRQAACDLAMRSQGIDVESLDSDWLRETFSLTTVHVAPHCPLPNAQAAVRQWSSRVQLTPEIGYNPSRGTSAVHYMRIRPARRRTESQLKICRKVAPLPTIRPKDYTSCGWTAILGLTFSLLALGDLLRCPSNSSFLHMTI